MIWIWSICGRFASNWILRDDLIPIRILILPLLLPAMHKIHQLEPLNCWPCFSIYAQLLAGKLAGCFEILLPFYAAN